MKTVMSLKQGIALLALLFVVLGGFWLYLSLTLVEEIYILPADAYIEEGHVGFNLDKDLLHFGIVEPNTTSSERFLIIENKRDYPVDVIIKARGDLKGLIITNLHPNPLVEGPLFHLQTHSSIEVAVRFVAPTIAKEGDKFFGDFRIIFKKQ